MKEQLDQLIQQIWDAPKINKLITIKQTARRLGVSTRTVYRLIADGQLEAVKVRGSTRLKESSVAHFVEAISHREVNN